VQQMEHEDANQREFACGALANIMADEQTAHNVLPVLMKADVLKKAVKCLSDAEPGVCAESAGLLRYGPRPASPGPRLHRSRVA
jgi:hypothetical protein